MTLPIPASQLHYADPAVNDEAQRSSITPFIDRVHYPTLGCPALLRKGKELDVLISLPEGEDPRGVALALVDRHGGGGAFPIATPREPVSVGPGPAGKQGRRMLWHFRVDVSDVEPKLYDLVCRTERHTEVQHNAVRIYAEITGREKVIFVGDSQFNVNNAVCLDRWIQRVNAVKDVAWIALMGDVCDNGVIGVWNLVKLAAGAKPGPVHDYYTQEFPGARQKLAELNKPVVLVPGNHDGMTAYLDYGPGSPSDAYLGHDIAANHVAYDGHHYFRRTFGPLYFHFDWDRTRYICANSFELDRQKRIGYHAIVANWGGWMRSEQLSWMSERLSEASRDSMHKVALMHHDPRGGALGKDLGFYSDVRSFDLTSTRDIFAAYLRYSLGHVTTFQQEWMKERGDKMDSHNARALLGLLLEHSVWAVVMGHDNENWIESYGTSRDIFRAKPRRVAFPAREAPPAGAVLQAQALLAAGEVNALATLIEGRSPEEATAILDFAVQRLDAKGYFKPTTAYAPANVAAWNLVPKAPIHFAHVDDIGAYDHKKESDFESYGYVVAQLDQGRPVVLQRFDVRSNKANAATPLTSE